MKTRRVELTARGKSLTEAKIQRDILQEDRQLSLLFIITMMPLNHILRQCTTTYKLSKSPEKFNHLMYPEKSNCLQKMKKNRKL